MKLGKRILLFGFVVSCALLLIDSQTSATALAQDQKKGDPDQKKGDPEPKQKKGGGGGGGKALPTFKNDATFKAAFREPIAKTVKSTVRIKCDGTDTALGVVLTSDGYILTKASDLYGKIVVKIPTGEELEAKWVGYHDAHDLAVLKIKAVNLVPIEFTDSSVTPVGYFVASPGTGVDPVAVGVLSVAARKVQNPTKKGGADGKAEKKGPGESKSGLELLGIKTSDDSRGAKVTAVQLTGVGGGGAPGGGKKGGGGGGGQPGKGGGKGGPESPAKGKVLANDIIVAVDNKAVKNAETFTKLMQSYKGLDVVTIRLIRGDDFVEHNIRIALIPDQPNQQNNMGSDISKRFNGFPVILQHDSVVLPKDCGGPLVDLDGNVIGINVCRAGRVDSHAVPSEVIRPLLPDLISGKLAPPKGR
ncbi:MAG TPA: trypsin-like peptidase domain-containing protein [Gemmataceae bacterium]|nr:trypsin-like peptidase domain-containing protein [Gemmataceae bacterium]